MVYCHSTLCEHLVRQTSEHHAGPIMCCFNKPKAAVHASHPSANRIVPRRVQQKSPVVCAASKKVHSLHSVPRMPYFLKLIELCGTQWHTHCVIIE